MPISNCCDFVAYSSRTTATPAMSMPATPTKRILTEEAHSAFNAPRSSYNNVVPDDLTARLQNVGSRVRKCVNEGYATQRFGAIPTATPTPFSSPVKPSTAKIPSQTSPIFRSANDTLLEVFSPVRASVIAPSPSPSPRKRGRAEDDLQEENEESSVRSSGVQDEDSVMGMEASSDDEDVTIITDASPNQSPSRPLRPLKKVARAYRPSAPPFEISPPNAKPLSSSADAGTRVEEATAVTTQLKGLFDQPF